MLAIMLLLLAFMPHLLCLNPSLSTDFTAKSFGLTGTTDQSFFHKEVWLEIFSYLLVYWLFLTLLNMTLYYPFLLSSKGFLLFVLSSLPGHLFLDIFDCLVCIGILILLQTSQMFLSYTVENCHF